jgi:hypothetical protein
MFHSFMAHITFDGKAVTTAKLDYGSCDGNPKAESRKYHNPVGLHGLLWDSFTFIYIYIYHSHSHRAVHHLF